MSILKKARGRSIDPGGSQERTFTIQVNVTGDAAKEVPVLVSPMDLYLKSATFTQQTTIPTHATNGRTLQLRDKGANGSGTTAAGSIFSVLTGGDNLPLTAFVDQDIKATNGYKLAAGNVLALNVTDDGTSPALDGILTIVCK